MSKKDKLKSFGKKVDGKNFNRRVFEVEVLCPDALEASDCTKLFMGLMTVYEEDIQKLNMLNRIIIKENSINGGMSIVQRRVNGKLQPIKK